jgi:hypothetical protein
MTELTWFLVAIASAALMIGLAALVWVRSRETH